MVVPKNDPVTVYKRENNDRDLIYYLREISIFVKVIGQGRRSKRMRKNIIDDIRNNLEFSDESRALKVHIFIDRKFTMIHNIQKIFLSLQIMYLGRIECLLNDLNFLFRRL